ncbi:DUF192 domain-containing protein [bacterium]|jgi:uncharacterized protein|nr:DUF192 domain-containing protein [bacterium]
MFRKYHLWVIIIGFLITSGLVYSSDQICYQSSCFDIEWARDTKHRSVGLMYRDQLPKGSGMLFEFDYPHPYVFWMKNTFITLDIIWLDPDFRIVHMSQMTPPCDRDPCPYYSSPRKALYVLEINGGIARQLNMKVGTYFQLVKESNPDA